MQYMSRKTITKITLQEIRKRGKLEKAFTALH